MGAQIKDPFGALTSLELSEGTTSFYRIGALEEQGITSIDRLPFSIRILLENVLRQAGKGYVTDEDVRAVAEWSPTNSGANIPFMPSRVVLQDFTGVPAVVDLAAMRAGLSRMGGKPDRINPQVPADLVIDHSVQVDFFGTREAYRQNVEREYERNGERYQLLRWAQKAFENFQVVPPGTGIVHQVNLEYLAAVVHRRVEDGVPLAIPDTLVGTDSHTTMINGLGVVGWGVGGIEAEAVLLGQTLLHAAPPGRRREDDWLASRRSNRDGPCATCDRDAQGARRRRALRRVLRPGPFIAHPPRPRDDREHVAGVRRHDRLLSGR